MRVWPPLSNDLSNSLSHILSCVLLFSLCAGPLAAEPPRSGELRLSPAAAVRLAPRSEDFLSRLCSGGGRPRKDLRKNSATCRDLSINVPRCCVQQAGLRFGIHSLQAREDGTVRAALFARAFTWEGAQPIETSCGRWTYSLRLDPRATQPMTAVTLRSGARDAAAGTLSGALPILAQLTFQKTGDGRRAVIPVVLRLDLTGTWTLEDSRLLFSIDSAESVITPQGAEP